MSTKLSGLPEVLAKLGYSKYALKSEVVTEEMLDDMVSPEDKTDLNGNPTLADGHMQPLSKQPTRISIN